MLGLSKKDIELMIAALRTHWMFADALDDTAEAQACVDLGARLLRLVIEAAKADADADAAAAKAAANKEGLH